MTEYSFVCVDAQGDCRDLGYAALAGDGEAKRFGGDLLGQLADAGELCAVVVYEGERQVTMLAELA